MDGTGIGDSIEYKIRELDWKRLDVLHLDYLKQAFFSVILLGVLHLDYLAQTLTTMHPLGCIFECSLMILLISMIVSEIYLGSPVECHLLPLWGLRTNLWLMGTYRIVLSFHHYLSITPLCG